MINETEFLSELIRTNNIEAVKSYIKVGNINARDEVGRTLLNIAVCNGKNEIVKLLLDAGADKEIKDNIGRTPLFTAVEYATAEIVKLLLDAGADKEVRNNYGNNPADLANSEIGKLLKSYKSKN